MRPYFESELGNYVLNAAKDVPEFVSYTRDSYHLQARFKSAQTDHSEMVKISFNGVDDTCSITCDNPISSSAKTLIEKIQEQIRVNDNGETKFGEYRQSSDGITLQHQMEELDGYQFCERVDSPEFVGNRNYRIYNGWMYAERVGYDPREQNPEDPYHVNLQRECYEVGPDEIQEWLTNYVVRLAKNKVTINRYK